MPKVSENPIKNPRTDLGYYRVRLMARLVVLFIAVTQLGQRLYMAFEEDDISNAASDVYLLTIPFLGGLSIIVLAEFFVYKKIGPGILKYSPYVDILFCLVFSAEWLTIMYAALIQSKQSDTMCYGVSAFFSFTSFSWRTLLQNFISQRWEFKIIPPVAAYILLMVYAVENSDGVTQFIILRGVLQSSYVILIFYFDSRINFRLLLLGMRQERWIQINDFILNNVPENIAIFDIEGAPKFVNEHFKEYMGRYSHSLDIRKFMKNIKELQQQQEINASEQSNICLVAKRSTKFDTLPASNLHINEGDKKSGSDGFDSLDSLVELFRNLIMKDRIKEKSFKTFNGKLNYEQDGSKTRSLEVKISLINQQYTKYMFLIVRDTTQRDQLVISEGNNKYKDHLLASVSHELRTPLNGNINLVEAALKAKDIPETIKQSLLAPALKSSRFLLHLINDILDMSQIKAQKLRLVFQEGNLRETLVNTIQLLDLHAKKKGIQLETNLDPLLSVNFSTDHVRLSQIVLNLLNNSIKFTQKGTIMLSAALLGDPHFVEISVQDTGIGMSREDIKKLFQDFTQIEFKGREDINPTGVGLGLSIAHNLARLLGPNGNDSITVVSKLGEGSLFSFVIENKAIKSNEIPEEEDEDDNDSSALIADENEFESEPINNRTISNFPLKSMKYLSEKHIGSPCLPCDCAEVLVVDDDPFNMLAYEAILNSLNVKFDTADNGKEALDKMTRKAKHQCAKGRYSYKLVLLDQEMPGMTGTETVRKIKSLQRQKIVPGTDIIGCSAHHDKTQVEKFMRSGIQDHIQKPVSADIIKRILEKYDVL